MSQNPLRLFTFSLSHFSEKVRWALSASDTPFVEQPWTPFFHIVPAIRSGGKTTVPILETDSRRVQDSTRIFRFLEDTGHLLPLLPIEPTDRAAAWEIEERFDRVGQHVVRYAYSQTLADAESVIRYWTLDSTPAQARAIRRGYPVLRFIFERKLRLGPRTVSRSQGIIAEALDWLEARVSEARPYLVADRFSIADLTAASLLAPLACPDEHPIYGTSRYRRGAMKVAGDWQARPAFDWVRSMYRRHRAPSSRAEAIRLALALE